MYRKCVAVLVLDFESKEILSFQRSDFPKSWQVPQGGSDKNETYENAAKRELFEETGIKCDKFESSCGPFEYNYPKNCTFKEKGQTQYWFLARWEKQEIKLNHEFQAYKWQSKEDLIFNYPEFKKSSLISALESFSKFL